MPLLSTVSLEEYLQTSYKPECEFISGQLYPKAMGSNYHSALQARLTFLLMSIHGLSRRVRTEQNLRVEDQVILIPDVCVLREENDELVSYIAEPPTLCIEVLSPSDRTSEAVEKCRSYVRWGVSACWIVDPVERRGWTLTISGLEKVGPHEIFDAGEFSLSASALFDA